MRSGSGDGLPAAWAAAAAAGRAAWPGIALADAAFAAFVTPHLAPGQELSTALADVRAADLYLAAAAAAGSDPARRAIVELVRHVIVEAQRVVGGAAAVADEIESRVVARLLGPRDDPGAPPAIAGYGGRAALRGWLRVIVVREATRLVVARRSSAAAGDDPLVDALSPEHDPELALMKGLYREHARAAFADAIGGLAPDHRLLLRQAVVDGLTIDELAPLHGVGRSTVARWLAAARDELGRRTRAALGQRLAVSAAEVDSILRLVRSRLDVSLGPLSG